jgi:purine-cytosine permease-like protein
MRPQRLAAFGLWAGLTFSCAVGVHGVIHAVGDRGFVLDSPAHVLELAVALGLLGAVAAPLGLIGAPRERRRRLALVRAGLGRPGPALVLFSLALQGGIAVALMAAEGAAVEPDRLAVTLLCGLLALLCSAFVFRATRDRVVALLARLVESAAPAAPRATLRTFVPRLAAATVPYRLFVPNRPPPHFAR